MNRGHFLELLERETDFQHEYVKLEEIVCLERFTPNNHVGSFTINEWINRNFRSWKQRESYTSFAEVRKTLGFPVEIRSHGVRILTKDVDMDKYFVYCEMILTLLRQACGTYYYEGRNDVINDFYMTVTAVIEKAGHILTVNTDGSILVVPRDPVLLEVVDIVPELADILVEYNHYRLRGNLEKKKAILNQISHALEPKRSELEKINYSMTNDLYNLFNNLDIRHNNSDPDSKNYKPGFERLSDYEIESLYDLTYQQALALFVLLQQPDRTNKIKVLNDFFESEKLKKEKRT